jgi:hypothetical protein
MEEAFGNADQIVHKNIKDNTSMIENKVMEYLFGRMGIFTKEIFLMIYVVVMVKCIGLTEEYLKDNG